MKVKTGSWHYKLIDHMDWFHPRSLCSYFWKTVLAMILAPVRAITVIFVVVSMAVVATSPFWWWATDIFDWFVMAIIVGALEVAALIYVLIEVVHERHYDEIQEGTRERKQHKQPSLLAAWISAKHRKICPFIEFEG